MKYQCTLTRLGDGRWQARHESRDVGSVQATAASREEVAQKIENEIRYRLELCPCSGESYQHLDIEIAES